MMTNLTYLDENLAVWQGQSEHILRSLLNPDESHSTRDAQQYQAELGAKKATRTQHLDDRAAAIILQSYLDAQAEENS